MPYGPQGQWRPADDRARALCTWRRSRPARIEETYAPPGRDVDHAAASRRASEAAKARAAKMPAEERRLAARRASKARWSK